MPAGQLTEDEKERCRHHTGYPSVSAAASMQFGLPKPQQLAFLLESAMTLVLPLAIPRVREILEILDDLEQQMVDGQAYLVADQLEELHLAGSGDQYGRLGTDRLETEYRRWAGRLVDIFGVPLYPFSARFQNAASGPRSAGSIPVNRRG